MRGMMSRAAETTAVMRRIAKLLVEKEIDVIPIHCGRDYGFIPLCDRMSKIGDKPLEGYRFVPSVGGSTVFPPRDPTDRSLFDQRIRPLLGHNFIDAFASPRNKKSDRFCSRVDSFESLGNGLALDWNGECIYAFPPFSLLEVVLHKVAHSKLRKMILITKDISTHPLWVVARRLAKSPPEILKKEVGLLYLNGMPGGALLDLLLWTFP